MIWKSLLWKCFVIIYCTNEQSLEIRLLILELIQPPSVCSLVCHDANIMHKKPLLVKLLTFTDL